MWWRRGWEWSGGDIGELGTEANPGSSLPHLTPVDVLLIRAASCNYAVWSCLLSSLFSVGELKVIAFHFFFDNQPTSSRWRTLHALAHSTEAVGASQSSSRCRQLAEPSFNIRRSSHPQQKSKSSTPPSPLIPLYHRPLPLLKSINCH
jgi:hypothetical protein